MRFICKYVTHKVGFSSIIVKRPFHERKERLMEDNQIIRLYFDRSEDAICQTAVKYGKARLLQLNEHRGQATHS